MRDAVNASNPVRELLEQAQAGDRSAFDKLLAEHTDRLEYYVRLRLGRHLRQRVEVDDVMQEVALRAYRSLDRFQWDGDTSFLRWLKGVAEHVVLEVVRSHCRDGVVSIVDDQPAGDTSAGCLLRRQERFERLQDAFESLSPDHRKVILLAYLRKLPIGTVAERLGRSPEAAKQLLWRALKQLRAEFGSTESFHLPDRRLGDEGSTYE
jgi:RNA polymerase sigma factor (sigma-70 family)